MPMYETVKVTFADGHRCYVTDHRAGRIELGPYKRSVLFEAGDEDAVSVARELQADLARNNTMGAVVSVVPEGA